ncbi:acyltransferase [Rasiella rasia]|uniref:Acyltransferase n=1 Tax=Rasiella rasia TaxID=2744027 RepID=A0A6G6GI50_9FLAO|nr:acyltransferase [Rasiella rasia]QIE58266.1 acyltransferase [Rasiella rasia]
MKEKIYYGSYLFIKGWDFPFVDGWRAAIVKKLLQQKSNKLLIRSNVILHGFNKLTIGDDVSINHGCFISAEGGLTIGNMVSIGHNTSVITTEHSFSDPNLPIKKQPIVLEPVRLHDNIWVGANVTILAGVTIASNTIIAAGAVVTKSILTEGTIVGGVPAKLIKTINS